MHTLHQQRTNRHRGYTLLFAVLFSSLLLAIGISILFISKKEVELSSGGRESQFAFYAADAGIECALYYDVIKGAFSTSSPGVLGSPAFSDPIFCNGDAVTSAADFSVEFLPETTPSPFPNPTYSGDPIIGTTKFRMSFSEGYCADVSVTKEDDDNDAATLPFTIIRAHGYNTCDMDDPRRVERTLVTSY
jgi:hypothetical protein